MQRRKCEGETDLDYLQHFESSQIYYFGRKLYLFNRSDVVFNGFMNQTKSIEHEIEETRKTLFYTLVTYTINSV